MTKVKYILIIILCLFTVSLQAGQQQGAGAPQVVASCTTDDDSSQWEPTDESGGNYGYRLVLCDKVVLGAGITVTSYVGAIYDHSGTGTGSVTFTVYNQDTTTGGACGNDCPDLASPVANSDKTSAASTLPDSYTETEHALASTYNLNSGTYYVCTEEISSADLRVRADTSSSGDRFCRSEDGSSISYCNDDHAVQLEIWGCLQ